MDLQPRLRIGNLAVDMVSFEQALDPIAGNVPRAPRWMSEHGLEWFYRFLREPRRLWRRYFLRDPRFVGIVAASLRRPAGERLVR